MCFICFGFFFQKLCNLCLFLAFGFWFFVASISDYFKNDLNSKINNLYSTDDGESSEESHGSSNCWQHVHKLGCPVLGDSVKGCWIKVHPYKSQAHIGIIFWISKKFNFEAWRNLFYTFKYPWINLIHFFKFPSWNAICIICTWSWEMDASIQQIFIKEEYSADAVFILDAD